MTRGGAPNIYTYTSNPGEIFFQLTVQLLGRLTVQDQAFLVHKANSGMAVHSRWLPTQDLLNRAQAQTVRHHHHQWQDLGATT